MEETTVKRMSRDGKRARSYDGGSSNGRPDIQDKPMFMKRFSNQVPTKFSKALNDRVSNPKYKKGRCTILQIKKLTCGKCSKKHYGEWLVEMDNFFGCGKSIHKDRDLQCLKGQ